MLKAINLKNFQGHKNSRLELSDRVNVIIGSTDVGKSSIVKAIKWVAENKPAGDSFRSHWGGDTEVELEFDNQLVRRVKADGKRGNCYEVFWDLKKEDDAEIYRAIGSGVPDEIKQFMGFDDLTFQSQHDSPFLLSSTAGEVAKQLNQIAHLEVIDSTLSNIKSRKIGLNKNIRLLEVNLEERENGARQFDHLDEIEFLIGKIEKTIEERDEYEEEFEELEELYNECVDIECEINEIKYDKKDEEILEGLRIKITERDELKKDLRNLITEFKDFKNLSVDLENNKEVGEILKEKYKELAPEVCPLCGGKWNEK